VFDKNYKFEYEELLGDNYMIDEKFIFVFIFSFLVTLISILLLRPFAKKLGIVDKPSKRKEHQGYIPLIGGISIFVGVYVSILGEFTDNNVFTGFLLSAFFILALGFVDDCYPLSAKVRLLAQILIVSLMVWITELKFDTFGHSFGLNSQIHLGSFSYPITVLGIVFVTNAFNLMDGADGLTGSLAILSIIGINVATILSDSYNLHLLSAALIGSLLPFLWFNLTKSNKNKIFLGDSGSMFLGYSIAFLLLHESHINENISPPFALWVIAIPTFDMISVMIFRFKNRCPLTSPDRSHLHHFLQRLGLSKIIVLLSIIGIGLLFLLLGLLIEYEARILSFPTFLLFLFGYVWLRVFSNIFKIQSFK